MKVFLYKASAGKLIERFAREVGHSAQPNGIYTCPSIRELTRVLEDPDLKIGARLVVLLAENHRHLRDLVDLDDLLADTRVVLVLPDFDAESLALGHSLYPRFMTSFYEPPEQLGAVVARMCQLLSASDGAGASGGGR